MWSHSDECFENCTFLYEVAWRQASGSVKATTTLTSYTIEGIVPGTIYEIGVRAFCMEDLSLKSDMITVLTTFADEGR